VKVAEISPRAIEDIAEIHAYVATDSPRNALQIVDEIFSRCEWLAQSGKAGRPRSEIRAGLRGWPLHSWIIFYLPTRAGIRVVRVLHGSRDLRSAMRAP